jgi:hypothetical protein
LYASSSTTITSSGIDAMNAFSTEGSIHVPVGLFGLATKSTRVCGVTAARIAARSCA